ncbi:MAG: carbohydrate ABC transporter permease [Chloroflexota bacterium]|jgi:raffinose/stachyose/melibiose transport system permease protein
MVEHLPKPTQRQKRVSQGRKQMWIGWLFVAPALSLNLLFDWYPMFEGIYRSFYRWDGYSTAVFVGLENFQKIFNDSIFWGSVANMLFFLVMSIVLMIPTIITSVILFRIRNMRGQYIYRILFCIPMVVPWMVIVLMWQFMYNPQYGLFNHLLTSLGLTEWRQTWLGNPELVKWCLIFMGFPFVTTNAALIYLGGLKSVSESVWEAGALDGVGPIQKFFYLEFPLILGQFNLNLIGTITAAITGYTTQLILTKGGPGFASMVPGLYMYLSAFKSQKYGYASALGLVMFVMSLVVTLISIKFLQKEEHTS